MAAAKANGTLMARRGLDHDHCRTFSQVELGGLEPPTPCLQSDVFVHCGRADLVRQLSVSSRKIPLLTPANGTLMARDLDSPGLDPIWLAAVCAPPRPVAFPGRPPGDAEGDDRVDRPGAQPLRCFG